MTHLEDVNDRSQILVQEVGHQEEADLEVVIDVVIDQDLCHQQNTRNNVILEIVKIHQDRDVLESSIWAEELLKTSFEEFLSDMENSRAVPWFMIKSEMNPEDLDLSHTKILKTLSMLKRTPLDLI
jgi:hypothetical protein